SESGNTEFVTGQLLEYFYARNATVLSVTLDDWSDEEIESMIKVGGNFSANSIYEASILILDGILKPGADSSHERCSKFIR
ncbi:hypothetical protein MKW98_018264, partial [Papaver atlanticum]